MCAVRRVVTTVPNYRSFTIGVLATERDFVSTYSRNYRHKRERLPSSNTRGGRPKRGAAGGRANPGRKKQGYCMCEAGEAGQERPATRLKPPRRI